MRLVHKGAYPSYWPQLAEAVRRAAGYRCIRCGHPAGDRIDRSVPHDLKHLVPSQKAFAEMGVAPSKFLEACDDRCSHPRDGKLRALTVHHMDGDKTNGHWWNLLALCQVCHLQVQAKLVPERPYLWEHKDWFKPYAAGFYAAERGIFLRRAQVEANLERYLRLGQPWLALTGDAPRVE